MRSSSSKISNLSLDMLTRTFFCIFSGFSEIFDTILCHKSFKSMALLWKNTAEEQRFLFCFLMAVFGLKPPLSLWTGTQELASCSVLERVVLCWLCLPVAPLVPLVAPFHWGSHLSVVVQSSCLVSAAKTSSFRVCVQQSVYTPLH